MHGGGKCCGGRATGGGAIMAGAGLGKNDCRRLVGITAGMTNSRLRGSGF